MKNSVRIIGDYGFCFGVENAIKVLEKNKDKRKILLHPLVHNTLLNQKLMKENNAFLYEDDKKINKDDLIIFSAHGHLTSEEVKFKNHKYYDAICPLITKRYEYLNKNYNKDIKYYFIGKKNHQETLGFLSHFPFMILLDSENLDNELNNIKLSKEIKTVLIPQTTISNEKFNKCLNYFKDNSNLIYNLSICSFYLKRATDAIKILKNVDISKSYFIVVGDKSSSNANEIYNSIIEKIEGINGTINISFENLDKNKIKDKDIYLISSTSVSKDEVLKLKDDIESFNKTFLDK